MPLNLRDVVILWICGMLHWFWPWTPRLLQNSANNLFNPVVQAANILGYGEKAKEERTFLADIELARLRDLCWEYHYYVDVHRLLEMPIDIMVMVFTNLHPIDLLNLTRANKTLHAWVSSPAFATAWKGAYCTYPDIPKSPDGFSPYKWTYLLFGSTACFRCHRAEFEFAIDFVLRARLCSKCLIEITVSVDEALGRLADLPAPRTFRQAGHSFFYTKDHLGRVSRHAVARFRQEKLDQQNGLISQKDYFENFKLQCQQAQEIEHHSEICMDWVRQLHHRRYERVERNDHHQRQLIIVKRQLVEKALVEYKRTTPASTWQNYPPLLAPLKFTGHWYEEDPTYDPTDWRAWPALRDIVHHERFQSPEAFRAALGTISVLAPEAAKKWRITVERKLLALCENLELATAIFVLSEKILKGADPKHNAVWTQKRRVFMGLSEVLGAWNSGALEPEEFDDRWKIHERGQDAVKSLAMMVGFDPRTLLRQEFDKVSEDYRFGCLNCSTHSRRGREARCWRDSAHHFANSDPTTHPVPHWGMVTPESLPFVKERESWRHIKAWSCNHCAIHIANHQFHSKVIRHIKIAHKVPQPVLGVNYIRLLTKESSSIEGKVSLGETIFYACSFCTDVLSLEDLRAHRKEKHNYIEDWQDLLSRLFTTTSAPSRV
ncbi:hypothetical protein C8J56DRAFT_152662 [Mycena floridula]|nr:hypothetical protein C8J56DRAFT_152662 [Mycena floridula]